MPKGDASLAPVRLVLGFIFTFNLSLILAVLSSMAVAHFGKAEQRTEVLARTHA
jgi:hypothetical protein